MSEPDGPVPTMRTFYSILSRLRCDGVQMARMTYFTSVVLWSAIELCMRHNAWVSFCPLLQTRLVWYEGNIVMSAGHHNSIIVFGKWSFGNEIEC